MAKTTPNTASAEKQSSRRKRIVSKNVELVSAVVTYLESVMQDGEDTAISPLTDQIELDDTHPHVNTVRDKLAEGFLFRDTLNKFEPTYKDGVLVRIRKLRPDEVKLQNHHVREIIETLRQVRDEIELIKSRLAELKK